MSKENTFSLCRITSKRERNLSRNASDLRNDRVRLKLPRHYTNNKNVLVHTIRSVYESSGETVTGCWIFVKLGNSDHRYRSTVMSVDLMAPVTMSMITSWSCASSKVLLFMLPTWASITFIWNLKLHTLIVNLNISRVEDSGGFTTTDLCFYLKHYWGAIQIYTKIILKKTLNCDHHHVWSNFNNYFHTD